MKIKTQDLIGPALDWAVALCKGKGIEFEDPSDPWLTVDGIADQPLHSYTPSLDWHQGGPIIEREKLELRPGLYHSELWTCWGQTQHGHRRSEQGKTGPTPLIAAMRCYVASKLGDEVEIPDTLINKE